MLDNPAFWVAIAFFCFLALLGYLKVPAMIGRALDARALAIKAELDEARRLREEAAKLLEDYRARHRAAEDEAKTIVEQARRDAEALAGLTRNALAETLERRTRQAEEKIARAEAQATSEVRAAAVDAAISAAVKILAQRTAGATGAGLVDQAIAGLKGRLS